MDDRASFKPENTKKCFKRQSFQPPPLGGLEKSKIKNKNKAKIKPVFLEQVLQLTHHLHLDGDDFGGLRVETVGRVEDISNVQVRIL